VALVVQVFWGREGVLLLAQSHEGILMHENPHWLYSVEQSKDFDCELSILYQEWVLEILRD